MSIVVLQVPEVKYSQADRPTRCPYCTGETFQRWGGVAMPVRDGITFLEIREIA